MVQKCFKWQFFTEGSFIRLRSEAVHLVKILQDNLFYFSFFFYHSLCSRNVHFVGSQRT